jgi:acetylornithine deacetylase
MSPRPETIAMIERLIAFDTTSRNSNLGLIEFIQGYLKDLGVESELVYNGDRSKANLYATLGPTDRGGIALSGHTDVVPVDGQKWGSDPFKLVKRDGQLFGRGTSDMKSFIAVCLALAPEFLKQSINTPLHFAFSYDEEIGCLGVRSLIDRLSSREVKPTACIIGEPTMMKVVCAHKGKLSYSCQVTGLESHSGMAHLGVNAVEAAAEVIAHLKSMARRFRDNGPFDAEMSPPYTTVHTGVVRGGTQLNIVPKSCEFEFEFRHLPQDDPATLLKEVQDFAANLLPEMHAVSVNSGFHWERQSHIPQLDTAEDSEVVQLAKSLTGANATAKVSFGTEAGLFERGGMPAVVCGPGSIEQAHKPDEFISLDQVAQCEQFMLRLFDHCLR